MRSRRNEIESLRWSSPGADEGGAGRPERGRVEKILTKDAAEARFGQVLFRIKPLE